MSEEIKEILDNFEKYEARYRLRNETQFIITHREIQILLDYITNLQENYERIYNENCKLREEHNITDISLLDENNRLKEENIKLKELCDKYEEEHKTTFEYWKHLIKEDYKTRIDKAIEYINEMCLCSNGYCDYGDDLNPEHIINILKRR